MSDGVEFCNFLTNFCPLEIERTEVELKVEHNDSHANALDLDIFVDKGTFTYKMLDKLYVFNFHIARLLLVMSNTPSIIYYCSTM